MKKNIVLIIAASLLFLNVNVFADVIRRIDITGNQRIEEQTIIQYLGVKVGDSFENNKEDSIINNLYSTSLFDNVEVNFRQGVLAVKVKEVKLVTKVIFEGNKKATKDGLKKVVQTRIGQPLQQSLIHKDVETIKALYGKSGKYDTQVTVKLDNGPNNTVKVTFKIEEGVKTRIQNIYFSGNTYYSSADLKKFIATKEHHWYSFLQGGNDTYDADRLDYDKQILEQVYRNVGYDDFRVVSINTDLEANKKSFTVFYSLDEGAQYHLGKISITNKIKGVDSKTLNKFINVVTNDIFSKTKVDIIAKNMTDDLANSGYPEVAVDANLIKNSENKIIDVEFTIDRVEKYFIGAINIEGNVKTEDAVIRNNLMMAEGDLYKKNDLLGSVNRLRGLNFFSNVDFSQDISPRNSRALDVNFLVQEKSTASIDLKAGYGTQNGLFATLGYAERNLFGKGQIFNASITRSQGGYNGSIGLTDPRLFGRDLVGGINLFTNFTNSNETKNTFGPAVSNYKKNINGARLFAKYNIKDNLSHNVEYLFKLEDIRNPGINKSETTEEIIATAAYQKDILKGDKQLGTYITSAITNTFTFDQFDNNQMPKNGYSLSFSQQTAGFGGQNRFLKFETDNKFLKSFKQNDITFQVSGNGQLIRGWGGKTVRIDDRFVLGDFSFRGFEYGGIGPRQKVQSLGEQDGDYIGGLNSYVITLDLKFPLGLPEEAQVEGHLFSDIGSNWGTDGITAEVYDTPAVRASAGVGIALNNGMLPIRIDYAIPFMKQSFDVTQRISLRMTTDL